MNKSLLAASLPLLPSAIEKQAAAWLSQTPFIAQLPPAEVANWCALTHLSKDELMLALLPLARCFANAPISEFYVGAIAEGASGTWYFGANQEYSPAPLGMTVHAEQCVITHARQSGEQQITTLAANYSPCGHCRQFMSEMSEALDLRALLPGRPPRRSHPRGFQVPLSHWVIYHPQSDRLISRAAARHLYLADVINSPKLSHQMTTVE